MNGKTLYIVALILLIVYSLFNSNRKEHMGIGFNIPTFGDAFGELTDIVYDSYDFTGIFSKVNSSIKSATKISMGMNYCTIEDNLILWYPLVNYQGDDYDITSIVSYGDSDHELYVDSGITISTDGAAFNGNSNILSDSDLITTGDSFDLLPSGLVGNDEEYTISIWAKSSSWGSDMVLFSYGNGTVVNDFDPCKMDLMSGTGYCDNNNSIGSTSGYNLGVSDAQTKCLDDDDCLSVSLNILAGFNAIKGIKKKIVKFDGECTTSNFKTDLSWFTYNKEGCDTTSTITSNYISVSSKKLGTPGFIDDISISPSNDTWHHIVVTYSGNTDKKIKLYFDGSLKSETEIYGKFKFKRGKLHIGSLFGGDGTFWNGSLSDFRIYDEELSADKISELFDNGHYTNLYCDWDDDGVGNDDDVFPNDASEHSDFDADGTGDNADTDDDNDEIVDVDDAFPKDASEQYDFDADGTGDNADTDDDNDNVLDVDDIFPYDGTEWADFDADGTGDNADTDDDADNVLDVDDIFPYDGTEWADFDADGTGDNADTDDDEDNVLDVDDIFPYDGTEWADFDADGTGDNADTDDDNDTYLDVNDVFPYDGSEWADFDADDIGDNSDPDVDGDGIDNTDDAFPNDPDETLDSDNDGVGDNADAFPNDPDETLDSDGDGVGDNTDYYPDDATKWDEIIDDSGNGGGSGGGGGGDGGGGGGGGDDDNKPTTTINWYENPTYIGLILIGVCFFFAFLLVLKKRLR